MNIIETIRNTLLEYHPELQEDINYIHILSENNGDYKVWVDTSEYGSDSTEGFEWECYIGGEQQ